jgi:hypothetical protein
MEKIQTGLQFGYRLPRKCQFVGVYGLRFDVGTADYNRVVDGKARITW